MQTCTLKLARLTYFATFASGQREGTTLRSSKLGVNKRWVEETSGFEMLIRDWWCLFRHRSTFSPGYERSISNFREIIYFRRYFRRLRYVLLYKLQTYLKAINISEINPLTACLPAQFWTKCSVAKASWWNVVDLLHPGSEQRHLHRKNRLNANLIQWLQLTSGTVKRP